MRFKEDLDARGWMLRPASAPGGGQQPPATHLFLDGGRAAVPDEHAGLFLNMYTNSILRGEKAYAVEIKTNVFRMFCDIDAQFACESDADGMYDALIRLNAMVAEFWKLEAPPRMVVCAAPPKTSADSVKMGFHVHWPGIVVNSPIALAFRAHAIEQMRHQAFPPTLNPLDDVFDACVYRANGLRMVYSGKVDEFRAYVPTAEIVGDTLTFVAADIPAVERRRFVHDLSVRVFDDPLTPCVSGIDRLADDDAHGLHRHSVTGTSARLEEFAEILPALQAALPAAYALQHFTGCFRAEHALMFKSSSRYCQNVGREHRTSTVYFIVTRRGLAQRCYCRKEADGCARYCSSWMPLTQTVVDALFPPAPVESMHAMPSAKTKKSDLRSILSRSRTTSTSKKKKR